jgi:hypothetical protein
MGLGEDFYTDLTLETYLDAISDSEPVTPGVETVEKVGFEALPDCMKTCLW